MKTGQKWETSNIQHSTPNIQCRGEFLTAHSRGRGKWDCVRQMQMYRRRPDVLAAALRDMGFSDSGDECEPHEQSADDHYSNN